MTPEEFVKKWSAVQQNERAAAQSHFNDVCALVGHPTPLEFDPSGRIFSFETQTVKPGGTKGFADVYFHDHFIWEYKGPHKDLDKAYNQLLLYRESLGNPPLLIVSDIHRIIIYTNFTNRPTVKHEIKFKDIKNGTGVELLKRVFFAPLSFEPEPTKEHITQANARTFLKVADALREHQKITGEVYSPEQLAHFLARLLFCLFAEDMGLLPGDAFGERIKEIVNKNSIVNFQLGLQNLFKTMNTGGFFGYIKIPWFNGSLFDDEFVPDIPYDLLLQIHSAVQEDWSAIEPSIFGTIFERVIDESKRSQLGAHYTSQADIELIVEPVLMAPLRTKWKQLQQEVQVALLGQPSPDIKEQAHQKLIAFAQEIAQIKVLDPACGSGNFLYVALRHLLDLQKDVIAYAHRRNLPAPPLTVSPQQMFGLEVNPYAHELAQITVWIGYLQWRVENGFGEVEEPILKSLNNIKCMDAILAFDEEGNPIEPEWPTVDVIIGNPPFLGGNKIRKELGDTKIDNLFKLYAGRMPAFSDLVCYWFERARTEIERKRAHRAGFIATNSIRGGVNRRVLQRIKESGDIFMAWSNRPWVLDGAAVRVSMVGFSHQIDQIVTLDGQKVKVINANLTSTQDISVAQKLKENRHLCFYGSQQKGSFDISSEQAKQLFAEQTPDEPDYREVIKPALNGFSLLRDRPTNWVIDFGLKMSLAEAQTYKAPFEYIKQVVYPERINRRETRQRNYWWLHARPSVRYRNLIPHQNSFIVSSAISKHRIFARISNQILADHSLLVFAREDDYFLGVLQSKVHECWALRMGTSLEDRPRYTPTTTFETFPFPWSPGREPAEDPHYQAISQWAKTLHEWREKWLNPPAPNGSKTVDPGFEKLLKKRTLTNLYNAFDYYQTHQNGAFNLAEFQKASEKALTLAEMEEFAAVHRQLDQAVLSAYGLPTTATEDEILGRLLALNAERAAENGEITDGEEEDEDEDI